MSREQDIWVSQIRKGIVEVAILGLLARGEMYGSQIVTVLAAHPELAISGGTVYPLLSRLKRAGLIDAFWRESPLGPPRKYYTLTPQGQREFAGMSDAWRGVAKAVDAVISGGAPHAGS